MGSKRTWAQEMAAFDKWSWEQEGEPIGNLSPAKAAQQAWLARASVDATTLYAQEEQIERLRELLLNVRNEIDYWGDTAQEHDLVAQIDAALSGSKRDG